jgi:hypothetical protein
LLGIYFCFGDLFRGEQKPHFTASIAGFRIVEMNQLKGRLLQKEISLIIFSIQKTELM